jgi:hypothetical protein
MAKHLLHNSDEDLDFALLGMSCLEDQYTVAALLDNILKIELKLGDYVPFTLKEGRIFNFSLFRYKDVELGLEYYLVPNTSNFEEPNINNTGTGLFAELNIDESVKLIRELPKTDYFLLLKGEDLPNYQFKILQKLKQAPELIQVAAIEPHDLPSRRNLIF